MPRPPPRPRHWATPPKPPGGRSTPTTSDLLPVLNRLLTRLHLEPILRDYLPPEDSRSRISPAQGLMVLLKNLLLSRQPLYGVPQWAARCDPAALGLGAPTVRRAQ